MEPSEEFSVTVDILDIDTKQPATVDVGSVTAELRLVSGVSHGDGTAGAGTFARAKGGARRRAGVGAGAGAGAVAGGVVGAGVWAGGLGRCCKGQGVQGRRQGHGQGQWLVRVDEQAGAGA